MPTFRFLLPLGLALASAPAFSQADRPDQPLHGDGRHEARPAAGGSGIMRLVTKLVEGQLLKVPGVRGVHDLHLWTVTSSLGAVSAHVVVADMSQATRILTDVRRIMTKEFGTDHVTIQIEGDAPIDEARPRGI